LARHEKAVKHDQKKVMWHTLPWQALEQVAKVMTCGANKYGYENWLKGSGLERNRYFSAALRHLTAYHKGEKLDPESGISHVAHAAAGLLMWLETDLRTGERG
jgi:hypothetical protein